MGKRGSCTFSAASVGKELLLLSTAIEKIFVLEAEVSRLCLHVSVLSQRLLFVILERYGIQDMIAPIIEFDKKWGGKPLVGE